MRRQIMFCGRCPVNLQMVAAVPAGRLRRAGVGQLHGFGGARSADGLTPEVQCCGRDRC